MCEQFENEKTNDDCLKVPNDSLNEKCVDSEDENEILLVEDLNDKKAVSLHILICLTFDLFAVDNSLE